MSRSFFVSLDGLDGCGKSTQAGLLAQWLDGRGFRVTRCIDPGGTPVGSAIRRILLQGDVDLNVACEAFLFMASRAQLVGEVIRPALEAGGVVVCDRFLLANVVYQGHAGGLPPHQLWEMGRLATGGLLPDLTFVLDVPANVARARRGASADRFERRGAAFDERVRQGFLAECEREPNRLRLVDATANAEAVQAVIQRDVEALFDRTER